MKAITVRPEFSALKDFTTSLPETFDEIGSVIHNSRNCIKKVDTNQGTYVVKDFKGMYFFNRLAYSLFRKSKAARSYTYSALLNDHGIMTPPHVAWIDCYTLGLLTRSYFVSVYYPYQTLEQAIQYYDIYDPSYKKKLFHDVAAFALKLHELGIYHEDFSLGNILVIPTTSGYAFALVDLNRIKFHKVDFDKGLRNFITLRALPDDVNTVISEYATLCGRPIKASIDLFWKYEQRKMSLRRRRRRFRGYTIGRLEQIFVRTKPGSLHS